MTYDSSQLMGASSLPSNVLNSFYNYVIELPWCWGPEAPHVTQLIDSTANDGILIRYGLTPTSLN